MLFFDIMTKIKPGYTILLVYNEFILRFNWLLSGVVGMAGMNPKQHAALIDSFYEGKVGEGLHKDVEQLNKIAQAIEHKITAQNVKNALNKDVYAEAAQLVTEIRSLNMPAKGIVSKDF